MAQRSDAALSREIIARICWFRPAAHLYNEGRITSPLTAGEPVAKGDWFAGLACPIRNPE